MNQGKMEMVKQEMARVNIDILGISELKWMGMGEFNSDDITSMSVGKNAFEKIEYLHRKEESKMQYLYSISKTTE